jgi:hypothetical protein
LIVLIANAHAGARTWQKRPASRDLSDGAVRRPIMVTAIGAWPPTLHQCEARTNLLFTMYAKQAGRAKRGLQTFFLRQMTARRHEGACA